MKLKNVLILTISLVMIMTSVVFAEIPDRTIILGDKAYDIDCLFSPNFVKEINEQLQKAVSNGYKLSFRLGSSDYKDLFSGNVVPNEDIQKWPEVTRVDSEGQQTVYDKGNGNVIGQPSTYYANVNVEVGSISSFKKIKITSVDQSLSGIVKYRVLETATNLDITKNIDQDITVMNAGTVTIEFLNASSGVVASGTLNMKTAEGDIKMSIKANGGTPNVGFLEVIDIY